MADTFSNYPNGVESPARKSFAVTPNDSTPLSVAPRAIMVGSAGNITGRLLEDTVDTVFVGLQPGVVYPLRFDLIKATGTTAGNIVGLT